MQNFLVISALVSHDEGAISEITRAILKCGCNLEDSRMTGLGSEFAMIMLVSGHWHSLARLETALPALEERLDAAIQVRRTEPAPQEGTHVPYAADIVSADRQGIVYDLVSFFIERQVHIQEVVTSRYAASYTGAPMFAVHMTVGVPIDQPIAALRGEFLDLCDQLNLDGVLEPHKG